MKEKTMKTGVNMNKNKEVNNEQRKAGNRVY